MLSAMGVGDEHRGEMVSVDYWGGGGLSVGDGVEERSVWRESFGTTVVSFGIATPRGRGAADERRWWGRRADLRGRKGWVG